MKEIQFGPGGQGPNPEKIKNMLQKMPSAKASAIVFRLDEKDGKDNYIQAETWNNYINTIFKDPEEAKEHYVKNCIDLKTAALSIDAYANPEKFPGINQDDVWAPYDEGIKRNLKPVYGEFMMRLPLGNNTEFINSIALGDIKAFYDNLPEDKKAFWDSIKDLPKDEKKKAIIDYLKNNRSDVELN